MATSIAGQAAVAIKKVQLIERLTERNAIKDFLEDLSRGRAPRRPGGARPRRSAATGDCPPRAAGGSAARAGEAELGRRSPSARAGGGAGIPGSLFDRRDAAVRGLVRLSAGGEAAVAVGCARSTPG